jgi:alkylhydroperoxidase family enzyme
MAVLLNEIEWGEPLLPAVIDPVWEADLKRRGLRPVNVERRIAPLPWLREMTVGARTYLGFEVMPQRLFYLSLMVVAQENACRYCYGKNRAILKIFGHSEAFIDSIERGVRVAEIDEKDSAVLAFSRNLARSRPRPGRAHYEALIQLGFSPLAVRELALVIAAQCRYNRIGTMLACPPEAQLERASALPAFLRKLMAMVLRRMFEAPSKVTPAPQPPDAAALSQGPFGSILSNFAGLTKSYRIRRDVDHAMASPVLSRIAKALIFAVVARTLDCRHTEAEARTLLRTEGMDDAEIDAALATLQCKRLAAQESGLLAWARETVSYETPVIQKHTRQLAARLGDLGVLEAIGIAALANGVARMAMLLE